MHKKQMFPTRAFPSQKSEFTNGMYMPKFNLNKLVFEWTSERAVGGI